MDGRARLQEIVGALQQGRRPRSTTVRTLLSWFGQERRGTQVVDTIVSNMAQLGIQTVPDFAATGSVDDKITFAAKEPASSIGVVADKSKRKVPPVESTLKESNGTGIDIGRKIRSLRTANYLTQAQLAEKIGVTQPVIALWEAEKQKPNQERTAALETILGKLTNGGPAEPYEGSPIPLLGRWLSQSLRSKKWTVVDLAKESGVSQPTLYNLLSGRAENPRDSTIQKLEKALGESFPFKKEIEEESTVKGIGEFLDFNPSDSSDWPQESGVYVLYDIASRPTYVGQGINIARRIKDHEQAKWFIQPFVQTASFIRIEDKEQRQKIEKILIKFLKNNALVNRQLVERD